MCICTAMAALQEMPVTMLSPDAISAKIQKYRQNKAKEKIRQRNENGWLKIHKEITDYWKDKQNREFIPCYIERDEYENKAVAKMHAKLYKSENPLDGWNWIKERFVRKLHERLFQNDEEYNEKAKRAIFAGYPFCPFERRVAFWITTGNEKFYNEATIQGLCLCCFMNGVYHKAMSVKGTELWEKDVFTKSFRIFITDKEKRKFSEDEGKTQKEQKKRMALYHSKEKGEKNFIPQLINGRVI